MASNSGQTQHTGKSLACWWSTLSKLMHGSKHIILIISWLFVV